MSSTPALGGDEAADNVIDLEQYAKEGRSIPQHKEGTRYRIRIDKAQKVVSAPRMTGEEILGLVEKSSTGYRLDQKLHGGQTKKIEPTDVVDFTGPGIEKFMTLPLDQTEGEGHHPGGVTMAAAMPTLRREFDLPEEDEEYLEARGLPWETAVVIEGSARALWLFVHDFPIPPGYSPKHEPGSTPPATALAGVRVTGYPGGALDMVYFHPPLRRTDGRAISNLGELTLDGKQFQQWSRHYTQANPFRVGVDSIGTHLSLVEEWLLREFRR